MKIGDKLKCIEDSNSLMLGEIYTVKGVADDGCVYLEGHFLGYLQRRFVNVTRQKKLKRICNWLEKN